MDPKDTLWQFYDASAEAASIWAAGADIGFVFLPDILVIPDPASPPGGPGLLGDIEQDFGGFNNESVEVDAALTSCNAQWANHWAALAAQERPPRNPATLDPGGITVIVAGELVAHGGGPQKLAAFTPRNTIYATSATRPTVCERPRKLDPMYLRNQLQWSIVESRDSMYGRKTQPISTVALNLAHELGHVLLLLHGDGQDNDNDGPFDETCDVNETDEQNSVTTNLMAEYPVGKDLTSLQRELAREAALLIRGSFGGP